MDAKQFLALNESMIAIQVLMSGKLADETASAKAALDALGNAQTLGARQDKLAQDKADFEAYKANAEAQIQSDKDKVNALQYQLTQDQEAHQSAVDALASATASLASEKNAFEAEKASQVEFIANAHEKINEANQLIATKQSELQDALRQIDLREQAVADKLAAMKALV